MQRTPQKFDATFERAFEQLLLRVANQCLPVSVPDMSAFAALYVQNPAKVKRDMQWAAVDTLMGRREYQTGKPFSLHHFTMKTLQSYLQAPSTAQCRQVDQIVRDIVREEQLNGASDVRSAMRSIWPAVRSVLCLDEQKMLSEKKVQDHARHALRQCLKEKKPTQG